MFKNLALFSLAFVFLVLNSFAQSELTVPKGKNILTNGFFHQGEWEKATVKRIDSDIELLAQQDKNYVYLAFKFLKEKHTGLDLYLRGGKSEGRMLHISGSLGEKPFQDGKWQDWIWGRNDLWTGNVINLINEDGKMKIIEPDGFEFQINKKLFESKSWSLRLHLKRPDKVIPKDSSGEESSDWIKIKL